MITTTVLGPSKAKVVLDGVATAVVGGYADLTVIGTTAVDRLTVTGMQRGTISTDAGNDLIDVTTGAGTATDLLTLDAGTGNDTVVFRLAGAGQSVLNLGDGNDSLSMWGAGKATVDSGAGNDIVSVAFGGAYVLQGGSGTDIVNLGAATGDLIFDRAADGSALLRLARNTSLSVQLSGFESIRFSDTVLGADMLEGWLPPRLVNGVIQLYGIRPATIQGIPTATILGSDAADVVTIGGYLRGSISLGTGNDVLSLTGGTGVVTDLVTLDAGAGNDTVTFRGNGAGKAAITLGAGADSLSLSGVRSATVDAGDGNDTVTAAFDGTYVLQGGGGTDVLSLGAALSAVTFGRAANDAALLGLAGNAAVSIQLDGFESIRFSNGSTLTLDQLAARLPIPAARESGTVQNTIYGSVGADSLTGTAGNDSLVGNKGADVLSGGLGDDRYQVYNLEKVVEQPNAGVDTVYYMLDGLYVLPANVENLTLMASQNRPAPTQQHLAYLNYTAGAASIGNALNNILVGSAADNTLDGKEGNDVLTGGGGKDVFVYGLGYGNDRITDFRPGTDEIRLVSGPLDWATASAAMTDTAGGVVLNLGTGNTLTLAGVTKAALLASDFQFAIDLSDYRLTFDDEFASFTRLNGRAGLTGGTWLTRTTSADGTLISPDEDMALVDLGTNGLGLNPFSVSNGVLSINATWRPDLAASLDGRSIVSGVISTLGGFAQQYGYFEARLKLSDQVGGYPAFWMLPTDGSWPPEIDVLEQIGASPDRVYQMGSYQPVDTTQWHIYGLEWTANRLAWTIDGKLTQVIETTAFNKPMYLILNYALGGSWAGEVPDPGVVGASLGSMQIDYVRAYELIDGAAPRATVPEGAPDVTFSIGALAPGGTPALADSWHYVADTSGQLNLNAEDLNFASLRTVLNIAVSNNRATDTYNLDIDNGLALLNVQVRDSDGGSFIFKDLAMAELHLGGAKASAVTLARVQSGYVELGAGSDTVALTSHKVWKSGQSATFQVYGGAGSDRITGWSETTGRLEAYGGDGGDVIIGSGAADLLDGGAGNDRLSGAGGTDVFRFVRGEGGYDQILDFNSYDRIQLKGFTKADMTLVDTGSGAEIRLPGETILVANIKAASLGDWAFQYV